MPSIHKVDIQSILKDPPQLKLWNEIMALKKSLADRVVVLSHHYQRPEIVLLGDYRGDSFELARHAAASGAPDIVFCGVRFMAEAAAILAREGQRVFHPDPESGCPMADMVDLPGMQVAWRSLEGLLGPQGVVPVVYMNSPADVKGFCGQVGGTICTSSNAPRAFRWALERGSRVLFLPDEHLGRNTAMDMGIPEEEIVVWDPSQGRYGGNSAQALQAARAVLWKGYCHVHTWFTVEHIDQMRSQYPGVVVLVHPECRREVVEAADGAGSTGYLVNRVRDLGPGSVVAVGTETSLVKRLSLEYPDRRVLELSRSVCPNMFRITMESVRDTLANFPQHKQVTVTDSVRRGARLALERMLSLPQ